ncbi:MAG: ribonuclease P [Candidatus Bathyarchaeia archaeon]|jgi:ribonuclease P protein subunit RPR2
MRSTGVKQIARQRIQILFVQAKKVCRTNPQLAKGYVKSAKKIAMAAKVRLPNEFKRETCKNCDALLLQGYNCRVRLKQKREPHIVVTCLNCGNQTRMLLRNKKEHKELEQNNYSNEAPC